MIDDARELIAMSIDSIESIELLMLLRRSPETFWTADAASQKLGITRDVLDNKARALAEAGLLVRGSETGAYRYAPASEEGRARVDWLAEAYANRRSSIINAIYSANLEKLRAFANAFKLTKDNE